LGGCGSQTWPKQDILSLVFVCARINQPFITPAHSHYPHYCITTARLLRHIYTPPDPPFICHTPYNIGNDNIVSRQKSETASPIRLRGWDLAFTRYSFTSRFLCTNQPFFHSPRQPALPTLVQYYCTTIGQYTTPPSDLSFLCHTPYNIGNTNIV